MFTLTRRHLDVATGRDDVDQITSVRKLTSHIEPCVTKFKEMVRLRPEEEQQQGFFLDFKLSETVLVSQLLCFPFSKTGIDWPVD